MRLMELLEGVSHEVYHYTRINVAADILSDGVFKLTSVVGHTSDANLVPAGYSYYLSTTRSKVGGYHKHPGADAVLFVLDGTWYNRRYRGGPVEYWGDRHNLYGRESEAEDRIFSKDPTIPITGVKELHIYFSPKSEDVGQYARSVMESCKSLSIPVYLYNDPAAWLLQDTRKCVSIASLKHVFSGPVHVRKEFPPSRYAKLPLWIELIHGRASEVLSVEANQMAADISRSPSYNVNDDFGLGIEMSNARKPNNAGRDEMEQIIKLMRANRWAHPVDIYRAMKEKWAGIKQAEYDRSSAARPI